MTYYMGRLIPKIGVAPAIFSSTYLTRTVTSLGSLFIDFPNRVRGSDFLLRLSRAERNQATPASHDDKSCAKPRSATSAPPLTACLVRVRVRVSGESAGLKNCERKRLEEEAI